MATPSVAKPKARKKAAAAASPAEARAAHQRAIVMRLRRVEGQVRGVLRMLEGDEPCEDIAQQLSAARQALDRAFYELMACSLETEIGDGVGDAARQARVSALLRTFSKYA